MFFFPSWKGTEIGLEKFCEIDVSEKNERGKTLDSFSFIWNRSRSPRRGEHFGETFQTNAWRSRGNIRFAATIYLRLKVSQEVVHAKRVSLSWQLARRQCSDAFSALRTWMYAPRLTAVKCDSWLATSRIYRRECVWMPSSAPPVSSPSFSSGLNVKTE